MAPFPRMQFQARLNHFIPVFSAMAAPRISPKGQKKVRKRKNKWTHVHVLEVCALWNGIVWASAGNIIFRTSPKRPPKVQVPLLYLNMVELAAIKTFPELNSHAWPYTKLVEFPSYLVIQETKSSESYDITHLQITFLPAEGTTNDSS